MWSLGASQTGFVRAAFNYSTLGSQCPVLVEGHAIAPARRIPTQTSPFSKP